MNIRKLDHHDLRKLRERLLFFIRHHGDKRITAKAIRWLQHLPAEPFPKGTLLAAGLVDGKIAGFTAFSDYGKQEAIIVVHPAARKQKIAEKLLNYSLKELGRVYTRVATDNIPSLKLCFSCGLKAFRLVSGPTGKPTLLLGGGNWSEKEISL